jgi:class 3 adenylate cyclase
MATIVTFPSPQTRIKADLISLLRSFEFPNEAARTCAEREIGRAVDRFAGPRPASFSFSSLSALSQAEHDVFREELERQVGEYVRLVGEELFREFLTLQVRLCLAENP